MKLFDHSFRYLTDKRYRFDVNTSLGLYNCVSDEQFLRRKYELYCARPLKLKDPQRYTEKIQWLKLYDRNPDYITMVDKIAVKDYVAAIIGAEHVVPMYGAWDSFDEIDFERLPDSFVLKCSHDSGGIYIVKDKEKFDKTKARRIMDAAMKKNFYSGGREWPYKLVKRRILAEQYLEDSKEKELRDYKFFSFDGKVPYLFIATDRFKNGETCFDFFDADFHHLPFTNGHPNAQVAPHKPVNFDLMLTLASKLSVGIPHVRVDFYEADGKVYFGEMTFFHHSGFVPFEPDEWDYKFGEHIVLPPVRR